MSDSQQPTVIHSFSGKRHYLAENIDPDNPPYKGSGIYGKDDLPALCDPNTFGRTTDKAAKHQAQWDGPKHIESPSADAIATAKRALENQPFCQRCQRKHEKITNPPAKRPRTRKTSSTSSTSSH